MRCCAEAGNIMDQPQLIENSKFRLNRKSALLTYPNVDIDLTFEDFKTILGEIAPIKRIVVGRETHPISR